MIERPIIMVIYQLIIKQLIFAEDACKGKQIYGTDLTKLSASRLFMTF
jgi:hypothetical protein